MVFQPGDVISYLEMCREEGVNLQRGMNFHLRGKLSVILMSRRRDAPYLDKVEKGGRVLIYEGHDAPKRNRNYNPKAVDQPMNNPSGTLTQNGLFYQAAIDYKSDTSQVEIVRVYEKIHPGIWVYNGLFKLIDSWLEKSGNRRVFKFKLETIEEIGESISASSKVDQTRLIPSSVKLEVWRRDNGRCVLCGNKDNLHFDHIIPYSKGGSSLVVGNIQLLCVRHNLEKRDKLI